MHALAIAPSQAADAQPTANGTVSRWALEPAASGPAQAPHPRLQQGCSPRSPNGEAAREPAPAETLVAGGSSPAAVDTALSDALREEKNRDTGTGTWNQMVLLRPGRPAGPESPVIRTWATRAVLGFEAAVEELLADQQAQAQAQAQAARACRPSPRSTRPRARASCAPPPCCCCYRGRPLLPCKQRCFPACQVTGWHGKSATHDRCA